MTPLPKPQKFLSRLASIEKVSSKTYLEKYELQNPTDITFVPGQTILLCVSPGINRSMSIASPPSDTHTLLLAHDVSPNGVYAKWSLAAKVGDAMNFVGPLGMFVLDTESHRKKVFVATGCGIAPFHSMLLDYLTHGGTDEIILFWGLRHEEDIFWQKELEELTTKYANFHFVMTLSQSSAARQSAGGRRGHVQEHIFTEQKNLSDIDWYLCGNKAMVSDMRARLKAAGVPDVQVKFELFF
jgi:ferredoxin-NADP reductase